MKKVLLSSLIVAIFLSACSTKRQYFEPKNIDGELKFTSSLPAKIKFANNESATLKNGFFLAKEGLIENLKLDKNEIFLGKTDNDYLIASINGEFKIVELNQDKRTVYEHKFDSQIVCASYENGLLAALSSDNKIYLIDTINDEILIAYASGETFAQNSKMANPVFLENLIIYPTLDGKIFVVDKNKALIIRDAIISSEPFFNNLIFLFSKADTLIAATDNKILTINPNKISTFKGEIKDLAILDENIFVLLKNGVIKKLDSQLNLVKETNFKYAIFSNLIIKNDNLYVIEKTGYLIKIDKNLENSKIYKLDSDIDERTFSSYDKFYFGDKVLEIE